MNVQWIDKQISHVFEKLAYDELTFVANFGGTLGLFLGFTFFMIWDWIKMFIEKIQRTLFQHIRVILKIIDEIISRQARFI